MNFDADWSWNDSQIVVKCEVYVTKCKCDDGSERDPVLYLLNICKLFNCSKNFICILNVQYCYSSVY